MSKDIKKETVQKMIEKLNKKDNVTKANINFFVLQAAFLLLSTITDFPLWVYLLPTIFVASIIVFVTIVLVIAFFIQLIK